MPTRRALTTDVSPLAAQLALCELLAQQRQFKYHNLTTLIRSLGLPARTLAVLRAHGAVRALSRRRYEVPDTLRLDVVLGPILRELWPALFGSRAERRRRRLPQAAAASPPPPPLPDWIDGEELTAEPPTFEELIKYTQWPEIFRRLDALEARLDQLGAPQLSLFPNPPTPTR